MYKICLVGVLFAASASAYSGSYGGGGSSSSGGHSGLIDAGALADEMALGVSGGSGHHSGSSGSGEVLLGGGGHQILSGGEQILSGGQLFGSAPVLVGNQGPLLVSNQGPVLVGSGGRAGSLAIQRQSRVDFVPVESNAGPAEPTTLFIDTESSPVNLVVRSVSHGVNLDVQHIAAKGTFRETASEDEPSRHVHTIRKPVIQEVHEVITPFRFVKQTIAPVQEEIITNVPKAVHHEVAPVPVGPVPVAGPAFLAGSAHGGPFLGGPSFLDGPALPEGPGAYGSLAHAGPTYGGALFGGHNLLGAHPLPLGGFVPIRPRRLAFRKVAAPGSIGRGFGRAY